MLSVVVPVYKEEANIAPFVERTVSVMEKCGCRYEIIFCLDPSPDDTYGVIKQQIEKNSNIKLIEFSRRVRQPTATLAGIYSAIGDACIVIDVDLQDPPELIEEMAKKWQEGYNVVYAQRESRKGETLIKKIIAGTGYKIINKYSEVSIPVNTGDFRLIDRRVMEELKKDREHHGFLRGMVAGVGLNQTAILYNRDERASGKGNYNRLTGSWRIGLNGIFCYSYMPLQFMTAFAAVSVFISFLLFLACAIQAIASGNSFMPVSSALIILLICIQLLFIAVIGEYIGRMYEEIKDKPRYIVGRTENMDPDQLKELDLMRR